MNEQLSIERITTASINALCQLAVQSFREDEFYTTVFPENTDAEIRKIFSRSIQICIDYGQAIAVWDRVTNQFVAFALSFDYNGLKNERPEDFHFLFYPATNVVVAADLADHIDRLIDRNSEYLYLLAIAVDPAYRRRGIASKLIGRIQNCYSQYNIFSDISNPILYRLLCARFRFELRGERDGCRLVRYLTDAPARIAESYARERVYIVLPAGTAANGVSEPFSRTLCRIPWLQSCLGLPYFEQSFTATECDAELLEIALCDLPAWQRIINPLLCDELIVRVGTHDALCYVLVSESRHCLNYTSRLREDISLHKEEWAVVPDIYTLIPVEYDCAETLGPCQRNVSLPANVRRILRSLGFRTRYESGTPSEDRGENDSFERRITRKFLELCTIQIYCESSISFDGLRASDIQIGEPVVASLILSYDKLTHCGVLHVITLASGLLLTQYLDSVSRSQISILRDGAKMDLYDYIEQRYGLHKRGSAKNYITFCGQTAQINNDFLASMIYCETYYNQGEALGRVIDPDIISQLQKKYGCSQYDYATAYFHTNSVVHIVPALQSVRDRIVSESVTLFYAEMALYEEAAMEIMNHHIIQFLTEIDRYKPGKQMRHINMLLSSHAKTIAFWNLKLNYPSSTKSMNLIRTAFLIPDQRERMELNKKQLMSISQVRQNYFSYMESRILSVLGILLTIFSLLEFLFDPSKRALLIVAPTLVVAILAYFQLKLNRISRSK